MKALITGGSGYFGSLLLRKLLAQGYQCSIFDINDADDRPPEVRFYQGDIRDEQAIVEASQGVDVIHHNVAQVPLAKNRHLFESVNIQGTKNLLEAAKRNSIRKVIYTSSSAVFGVPKSNPVTEQSTPTPMEAYGQAKYEAEKLCHAYVEKGCDISIIRPRTIMGHGRLGIFQILFEWIYQGANVPVFDDGKNIYQFVHADDLAELCRLAGEKSGATIYNCGAKEFASMRAVLEHLCEHSQTGSKVRSVPMTPAVWGMKITSALGLSPLGAYHALMYGRSMYFDTSKAEKELAWTPKYSNNQMFVESYQWYVKHRQEVLTHQGSSHHRSSLKQGVLRLVQRFL